MVLFGARWLGQTLFGSHAQEAMKPEGYWFKSSKFDIEPGEDDEINPRMYGRQLSIWLKERLERQGYSVEDIFEEDWGRCLMCAREPFWLWVGCGSIEDHHIAKPGDPPPAKEDVVWHCFATAEVFSWRRLFRKIDTVPAVSRLHADLGQILSAEPEIRLVGQP
jgi:hypothetical protein